MVILLQDRPAARLSRPFQHLHESALCCFRGSGSISHWRGS
jgi:hypothetical protein